MRGIAPLATALCCAFACSSGGGGDLDHIKHQKSALGTPIAAANNPASPLSPNTPIDGRGVVVVAVDSYDETGDGKNIGNIYVQDPIQPTDWSGLVLFSAIRNPINLTLAPGAGVDIAGPYQPFKGPASGAFPDGIAIPEMVKGGISLSYEGRDPTPVDVTLEQFKVAKDAMKFVARLVRITDVTVTADFGSKRAHEAPIVADQSVVIAAQLFAVDDPAVDIKAGTKLASVTGVMNSFYSFKLCPRSPADIQR
ncbi:MAG: hypothetical protein NVS3B20_17750 [Polyangiales bacterium]